MLKRLREIHKTIWQYYIYVFLINLRFFSGILVPFFTHGAHLSIFQVQSLQSWYMLWIFIFEIPSGIISDRFGRKYSLALGAVALSFSVWIFGFFNTFGVFMIAELLYALSLSLVSGSDKAFIYDALKEKGKEKESKRIFGIGYSISLVALLTAGSVSGLIAIRFDLHTPMFISIIPFVISAIVILASKEPMEKKKKKSHPSYMKIIKGGVSYLYNHKLLRPLVIDGIIVATSSYFIYWLYPLILDHIHAPLSYYGYIYGLLLLSQIFVAVFFVQLEKLSGSARNFFLFSAIVTGISFIISGIVLNTFTLLLLVILGGGFGISRFELLSAYMNKYIESNERATVLSFISMARRAMLIILNPLIGLIATRSLQIGLIILGIIPFLVIFFDKQMKKSLQQ